MPDPATRPTTSYEARPEDVHRVLLLYSGGLDTSVMLKWIQEQYGAEVVALTVDLGQPGEDYDVVRARPCSSGRSEVHVMVDAREEFVREYVPRRSRPTRSMGSAYPLFTALGSPLIAKLAVAHARRHGCDTIAHGCTGKGNDQVRIEATIATLAPGLKVIAPVRSWRMGREEEVAYARERGIPVKGGIRGRAVLDRRQPLGTVQRGPLDRGARPRARRRRLPARDAAHPAARRGRRSSTWGSSGGSPSPRRRAAGIGRADRARGAIGARHGVGIVDHTGSSDRRAGGPRHL